MRTLVSIALVAAAGLAALPGWGSSRVPASAAPLDRPNIIFILTDDQDARSVAHMPRLRALLADRGTSFSNAIVTYPLCCPSRATILRGQYPHNTQILGNQPPLGGFEKFRDLNEEASTVGVWLRAAGYRTAFLGKYLNGYPDRATLTHVPPGWDEWVSPAQGTPYANFAYRMNENGRLVDYGRRPEDYLTDVLARKATAFIRQSAESGWPFFVYLATYAPHDPATPAPRHADAFPGETAPRAPSFNEADVGDKPAWVRSRPTLPVRAIEQIDEHHRTRLRSLLAVDEMIGALVDALAAAGQLERTYLFYTSDNGWHQGEHRVAAGKITPYEESIRVPLVIRGPGIPQGRTLNHLVGNHDYAPTFAQIAGAAVAPFVDGRSLLPLLGPTPPEPDRWRQGLLVQYTRANPDGLPQAPREQPARRQPMPTYHALRASGVLYVEYATGERELYDLSRDPAELQNLQVSAAPDLLRRLAASLAALRACARDACRAAENAPAPAATGQ